MCLSSVPAFQINAYTKRLFFTNHDCDAEKDVLASLPANLAQRGHLFFMYISVGDIKSAPQPTVPLFNTSEIQFRKKRYFHALSHSTVNRLPSKVRAK